MNRLLEDARALMDATTDVAGEKIKEARQRLSVALEGGRVACGEMRDKAVQQADAANVVVHAHPYQAIGVAFGVGAILGFLGAHRSPSNGR